MKITLDSSLFYAGIFDSGYKFPDMSVTDDRIVTHYELEIFTESGGTAFINGEGKKIRPGLALCARPGDIRHTELPTKCYYVKISPQMSSIAEILDSLGRFFKLQDSLKCAETVKSILTAKADGEPMKKLSKLLELLSVVCEESERYQRLGNIPQKKGREAVELAIEYMENHFREKCTLEDIAAYAHFSPIYFHGMFNDAIGKTPFEYISGLRIEEAKHLLLTESLGISEIAESCGFSSQSYFNYVFKKATGLTPRAYRRQSIAKYCT